MAKISYKDSSLDTNDVYYKTLVSSDRFVFSTVRVRKILLSRKRIKGLTQKSLLPAANFAWYALGSGTQNDWKSMYADFFNNGYKAFIKAFIQRRQFGLTSTPESNIYYLGKVGKIEIVSPGNRCHIVQRHPNYYYVMKKVSKTKSQYIPVRVNEFATFPFNFKISYKSNLTVVSDNPHANIYVRVYTNYQGRVLEKDFIFPITLIQDWNAPNMNIDKPLGTFKGYDVHIDLYGVRGQLYLDNFILYHDDKNWARDPNFDNMKTSYTRKYYQIESHWDIEDLPSGASFDSIYYED